MLSHQRTLFFAVFVAAGYLAREGRYVWEHSHFARGPLGIPYPESIAAPRTPRVCGVPELFLPLSQSLARPIEKAVDWCLPKYDNARNRASAALARLSAHMEQEASAAGLPGLAAPQVGVPLKLVVFRGRLMLNPVIRTQRDESWCVVRDLATQLPQKIRFHKWMEVEYRLSDGGVSTAAFAGEDAGAVKMLLLIL